MQQRLTPAAVLPEDHARAVLIGRAWVPAARGPVPVLVREDGLYDLRGVAPPVSHLLELASPAAAARRCA